MIDEQRPRIRNNATFWRMETSPSEPKRTETQRRVSFTVTWKSLDCEIGEYVYSMNGGLVWHGGPGDGGSISVDPEIDVSQLSVYTEEVEQIAHAVARGREVTRTRVTSILNGESHRRAEEYLPPSIRNSRGIFFTDRDLADQLLLPYCERLRPGAVVLDPSCGVGDLLLAAARLLPCSETLGATLNAWGGWLHGVDTRVDPQFTREWRASLMVDRREAIEDRIGRRSNPKAARELHDHRAGKPGRKTNHQVGHFIQNCACASIIEDLGIEWQRHRPRFESGGDFGGNLPSSLDDFLVRDAVCQQRRNVAGRGHGLETPVADGLLLNYECLASEPP